MSSVAIRSTIRRLIFGSSMIPKGRSANLVWALFRAHIGLSIALGAGLAKVVHKIDGNQSMSWDNLRFGVEPWFVKQVAGLGFTFPSPEFWASAAAWGELVGGLGIAFGLLTRLNGIQLAVQFFVVAFLWYKEPVPIAGMYYQQLLFWGFLLVATLGGGRYSLDALVVRREKTIEPEKS